MRWTYLESESQPLPPPEFADPEGLVAIGGELTEKRLLEAYSNGIYPWYDEDTPPMWWSPDPRMVLYPEELHIPKSMRPLLNRQAFEVTVNKSFSEVIEQCAERERPDQDGTWIVEDLQEAYIKWHESGYVHSFEARLEGALVGGFYGVSFGKMFYGESMFATVPNASKYAFIKGVQFLKEKGIELIDCQMETEHLKRFGARNIPRAEFIQHLRVLVKEESVLQSIRGISL